MCHCIEELGCEMLRVAKAQTVFATPCELYSCMHVKVLSVTASLSADEEYFDFAAACATLEIVQRKSVISGFTYKISAASKCFHSIGLQNCDGVVITQAIHSFVCHSIEELGC